MELINWNFCLYILINIDSTIESKYNIIKYAHIGDYDMRDLVKAAKEVIQKKQK